MTLNILHLTQNRVLFIYFAANYPELCIGSHGLVPFSGKAQKYNLFGTKR
jgi:hypothetical protein